MIKKKNIVINKGLETPKLLSVQKRVDRFLLISYNIERNDKKNKLKVSSF